MTNIKAGIAPTIRDVLIARLQQEPHLFIETESSHQLVWASWDGRDDVGYWVTAGTVESGGRADHGSGFVIVTYLDGRNDDEPITGRQVYGYRGMPAAMVGDGSILAELILAALRSEREATRREPADSRKVCECIHTCADDPATACSLSGEFHTHPGEPCPVHPDAPCTP